MNQPAGRNTVDKAVRLAAHFTGLYLIALMAPIANAATIAVDCDAGNTIIFTAPSVQISNVKSTMRGDILVAGLDLDFVTENSDDEFRISLV